MQEKPKESANEPEKSPGPDDTWERDQADRGYYYDDAHGYEVYCEDDDEDDGSLPAGVD